MHKINWRRHELILISLLAGLSIASCCQEWLFAKDWQIEDRYRHIYYLNNTPFNYTFNVLLPKIGIVLLFYGFYVVISRLIVPYARRISWNAPTGKVLRQAGWLLAQLLLVSAALKAGADVATYWAHPWLFNYGGWNLLTFFGYNEHPLSGHPEGLIRVLGITVWFLAWVGLREIIIYLIERPGPRKAYRILIGNQVTAFGAVFFATLALLAALDVGDRGILPPMLLFILPVIFTVCMLLLYWFFPWKGEQPLFRPLVLLRWLACTLLPTVSILFYPHLHMPGDDDPGGVFFLCWMIQLFVVTPLTWLLYRQRKDRILRWRGMEKELLQSKTDLQFLRSQINPHFLFNTLNTLYGTALREKADNTASGIQLLGDMMRFLLHENNQDFIPMEKEIGYLQNYLTLQRLRIQDSPDILLEDNIGKQVCGHLIAPMLLVPLAENAFKHGISLESPSWVRIWLHCDARTINFEVKNSIHAWKPQDDDPSGIGLKNVAERLQWIYPGRHLLTYGQEGEEFRVRLLIQVEKN